MRRVLRVRVSAAQPARCCWHDPSAGELDTPTHAATSDSELGVRRRYRDSAGGPGRATPTTRSAQLLTPAPSSGTLRTRARAAGPRRSGSRDRREARLRESGREAGRSPRPAHPAVVETDRRRRRTSDAWSHERRARPLMHHAICIARAVSLSRISWTTAMGSTPNRAASATT